ncbi:proto-oncogene DBL-like isoform X1 [Anguilla anguilla]|uniref:proto-oncogene DBL-like isoform X1 n=1 Tax=Anguilla anguilla TaxID=7936 RepID=UPI0015AD4692|nr:proto-oncogene DBL-like isoform X1 [Anguilla anguilla]
MSEEGDKTTLGEMESYHKLLQTVSQLEGTLARVMAPMSIKEVHDYMEKQVAYLSGGRGKESSAIVTFPECTAFRDIPDDALDKVLKYLTFAQRIQQPGVKFVIILDRRLDTWTSIKIALAKIEASFPGNLHLVLVLRPTSFLQRTATDIGFRFSQEDFMLKMPVIMLSSVTDLLRYIDENQLTSEFGGTLEYCHSDWIVLRTAIESFAVTVKEIAQMLQAFGTDLAETDLPDEGNAIDFLLLSHTDKYRQLKDNIRSVMRQGRHLLSSLEASRTAEADSSEQRDANQDWETVQRLMAQLRDMEMAFDEFFEKHHLKLKQYLQLLRYEQSFHEMEATLEKLSSQVRDIANLGATVAQTEQLIKDLDNLNSKAEDEMGRAQIIILHGHQLAASHHYAMALIVQRCNELRHLCDVLTTNLKTKRAALNRTRDLLLRLEEVLRWCDEGAYLLASQLVDKFQSKEGAQAALWDIEKLQERAPPPLSASPDVLSLEFESVLTQQLQAQIGAAHDKFSSVQGMVQNRQASLRKLADVQVRPVQLVAPRPENPPRSKSPLFSPKHGVDFNSKFSFDLSLPGKRASRKGSNSRKIEVMHDYRENRSSLCYGGEGEESSDMLKRHVIKELIETERIYVEELLSVLLGYRAEMDNPALSGLLPPILRKKKEILFGNMPEIYNFHSRIFLQDLEGCLDTPERVGACFLERKENFQVYERYCQNKPRSESLWRQCSDCVFFQECQKRLDHKLGLDSYLLKPIQRLTKYQLLLKELLKYSVGCERFSELQGALTAMLNLLKSVNDSMHQIAITGYEGDLSDLGRVLMQGSFSVWISHKKGPTRMKELARFKPMQRHLFLHERALLFCKRREEHGEGYEKTASYSFKHCLRMSAVGITENVKGDVKKFEIWYSGREEVYVVQAPTLEVKVAWLNEIRKILTNQQKVLQDESVPPCALPERSRLSPPLSDSVLVCTAWSPSRLSGCSACFDVPPHSKLQSASYSSEETESGRTSPVLTDPVVFSPQPQLNRRSWPGTSQSVDCDGLEDWSGTTDLSNLSDSEEEDDVAQLIRGRYRATAESQCGPDDLVIKCGDVIQLLQEEAEGLWLVKNVTRYQEGRVSVEDLQLILGEGCRAHSSRLGDPGNLKTRKLSSP